MKINVNGIEMYYEKYGEGRPLVLVHGNSVDHREFKDSIWLLRRNFAVYAVDSRGHGLSTKVDELHYSDMADDIVAFMDQLDLRDVVYFGHSDGGIIGLLAAMRTDRIGLLLPGSANLTPYAVAPWLRGGIKAVHTLTKDPKMLLMLTEPNITPEELATIKTPTVVIAGSKDIVDEKETRLIAESIPGAKLRILEGEGHISYATTGSHLADIIMEEEGIRKPGIGGTLTEPQKKILKGAQQGELDAAFMYEKLAEAVDDPEDRKAFERLAADEARHADVFFRYTGQTLKANPAKAILIPAMYKTVGREKLYPIIAKAEYDAADKYKNIIADFPEVEEVMNDEVHHGDAVMGLLE
jgi:pimeloyl-ACP methyl ester carboxylesterase